MDLPQEGEQANPLIIVRNFKSVNVTINVEIYVVENTMALSVEAPSREC